MSKKSYQILPHPADIIIQAQGKDLSEIFKNCAKGLMAYIFEEKELNNHQPDFIEEVKLESQDQLGLLIDWLSELLYLSDYLDANFYDYKIKELTDNKIIAEIYGKKMEAINDVKAITYHQSELKKSSNGYLAKILCDI